MELNDIYDKDRNLTGRTHRRGTPWKKGEYGLVVCVWVYDGHGNLLLTRRAPQKSYAGTWESFSLFCDKYIVPDPKGKLTSAEIQNAYRVFCNQHDYVELASNQWSQVLRRNIPCKPSTAVKRVEGEKKTRGRAYKGITFSKSISDLLEKEPVVHNDSHGSNSDSFLPSNYNSYGG